MEKSKKKYFAPINNFAVLKEIEKKYNIIQDDNDLKKFLDFWQWTYEVWRKKNSPFEERYTLEKIRVRSALIKILGIR